MKLKSILFLSSAMLMFTSSFGQLHVSTGTTKYVLFEEATGAWCGYCPDGAQVIEEDIKGDTALNKKTNIVSWHGYTGYGEPMMLTGDNYHANSNYDSLGYPSAVIDRAPFGGQYSQNRGYWATRVASRVSTTANFQVDMKSTYDTTLRLLTVTVTGKALSAQTGKWNINAYVTEDSVSAASGAYQQKSYMYGDASSWYYNKCTAPCGSSCTSCAYLPDSLYKHMSVARAILATTTTEGGLFGDAAFTNPASGATFSKTYTYTVPAGYNHKYMKVIGLVAKYGGTQYDRAVENSITAKFRLMPKNALGVVSTEKMTEIELYPNPANNMITVKGVLENSAPTRIMVSNIIGQTLITRDFPASGTDFAENISLSNLSSGTYLMTIVNGGEKVTKRFTVNK